MDRESERRERGRESVSEGKDRNGKIEEDEEWNEIGKRWTYK